MVRLRGRSRAHWLNLKTRQVTVTVTRLGGLDSPPGRVTVAPGRGTVTVAAGRHGGTVTVTGGGIIESSHHDDSGS